MMALRVLHVIQTLTGGGAEKQVCSLLPHLQQGGIQAGVLSIYPSGLSQQELAKLGSDVIEIGGRHRSFAFVPALVRSIRAFRPDIVHTHTHVGKYWGRIAARLAGVPVIVHTAHNPCDPRRGIRDSVFDRLLNGSTQCVVTFLEDQRTVLARLDDLPADKIRIIPNGLPHSRVNWADQRARGRTLLEIDAQDYAVLMVGRMGYPKNARLAIEACAVLHEAVRSKMRLYFVGGGDDEGELRRQAASAPVDVRFLGRRNDVATLLAGADALLMTSLFEGMPIVFIEAMQAGTAIVTTPWTGAGSMLGRGDLGFISASWSADAVASALEDALTDDVRRHEIAARAQRDCETRYDIGRVASAHRALYHELAAELRVAV